MSDYGSLVWRANSVNKILKNGLIEWKYWLTKENPAGISSQGNLAHKLQDLWQEGPNWVKNTLDWPDQLFLGPTT